jgi:hypothetical protein
MVQVHYFTARSMKESVDQSTIIVSGQASVKKEILNISRDVKASVLLAQIANPELPSLPYPLPSYSGPTPYP